MDLLHDSIQITHMHENIREKWRSETLIVGSFRSIIGPEFGFT